MFRDSGYVKKTKGWAAGGGDEDAEIFPGSGQDQRDSYSGAVWR